MTIGEVLDQAQEFLHDDGEIWSRTELLDWANDGYRQLLAQSHAVVRPFQLDVPGRTAWAGTQEWEDRHGAGTFRLSTYPVRSRQVNVTYRWEAQTLEGISPEASLDCMTHLWELYFVDSTDRHMRLVLSKQHERPLKVYHDDKRLIGASTRELDSFQTDWWTQQGDPIFWFPSQAGRDGSYEIYEVPSSYVQAYHQADAETGMPRLWSGDRTYAIESNLDRWDYAYTGPGDLSALLGLGYRITTVNDDLDTWATFSWELDEVDDGDSDDDASAELVGTSGWESALDSDIDEVRIGIGVVRSVSSPDRQYIAAPYANADFAAVGVPRDFKSSVDAITVWEIIVSATQLDEDDGLSLIPPRMAKYIRYYVLSRAFSRKGEGLRPDLAQHFTALFQIGVGLLSRIGNLGLIDRGYAREEVAPTGSFRLPQVQFPPEFERAR